MKPGSTAQLDCELFYESVVYTVIGGWASCNIEVNRRIHCLQSTTGRHSV